MNNETETASEMMTSLLMYDCQTQSAVKTVLTDVLTALSESLRVKIQSIDTWMSKLYLILCCNDTEYSNVTRPIQGLVIDFSMMMEAVLDDTKNVDPVILARFAMINIPDSSRSQYIISCMEILISMECPPHSHSVDAMVRLNQCQRLTDHVLMVLTQLSDCRVLLRAMEGYGRRAITILSNQASDETTYITACMVLNICMSSHDRVCSMVPLQSWIDAYRGRPEILAGICVLGRYIRQFQKNACLDIVRVLTTVVLDLPGLFSNIPSWITPLRVFILRTWSFSLSVCGVASSSMLVKTMTDVESKWPLELLPSCWCDLLIALASVPVTVNEASSFICLSKSVVQRIKHVPGAAVYINTFLTSCCLPYGLSEIANV